MSIVFRSAVCHAPVQAVRVQRSCRAVSAGPGPKNILCGRGLVRRGRGGWCKCILDAYTKISFQGMSGKRKLHRLLKKAMLLQSSVLLGAIPSARLRPANPASAATAQGPRPLPRHVRQNRTDPGRSSLVRRATLVLPCLAGSRADQCREQGLRQSERQPRGSHVPIVIVVSRQKKTIIVKSKASLTGLK